MSGPAKTPQLTLHHLNNSRSERLFWLCEELGLPYEVKVYLRTPILAPPELKQIHPLGKAPVLVDGEQTIAESGTIVDYLLQTYSPTRPTFSLPDNYFSHYAEGSLMLYLQMGLVFTGSAKNAPWLVSGIIQGFANKVKSSYIDKTLRQHFDFLETELGKSPTGWFGHSDSPTAADYMMLYPIHAVITNPSRVEGLTIGPNIQTWWDKVQAREAYQRGVARLEQEEAKAKDAKDA